MKKRTSKIMSILMLLLFCFVIVSAQTKRVTGTVVDKDKIPMSGVNIFIKNTQQGTSTDQDGRYQMNVPEDGTLIFSMITYETQEIPVAGKQIINVVFTESKEFALEEVVVIGYGSVRKDDLTGAITRITDEKFAKGAISTPDRLLVGKVAGVQITPGGGAPGSGGKIMVRGGASLKATNEPLIVVDGVPVSGDVLRSINPGEIESMNVLKDASAAAIYGSRASNGVIIVTTKKAKYGQKLMIAFNTRSYISHLAKELNVLNADEITRLVTDSPYSNDFYRNLLGTHSTNWQDEIFSTAFSTDNNLNISGSVKNLPYRVSVGYTLENGMIKPGKMDRWTGTLNLNPRLFENHLKIDLSAKGGYNNTNITSSSAIIKSALAFDPTKPVRSSSFDDYEGYYTWLNPDGSLNPQGIVNPVLIQETEINKRTRKSMVLSAQVDYKTHFLPELRVNLNMAHDYSISEGYEYIPAWSPQLIGRNGKYQDRKDSYRNQLLEFYLNYAKDVKSINSFIDVTAGYSYQDWKTHTRNYAEMDADKREIYKDPDFSNDFPRNTLISFFGRLNYTLMNKYLLTLSLRNDGSSRFHPDYRWGIFPAAALAWKIKEESFLKEMESVSDLKIRLGYGQTGQQDIGWNYAYIPYYSISTDHSLYQFGDTFYKMYSPSAYDQAIKWESTTTYNVGLDFGFLQNRITGSIDIYRKDTKDLLNFTTVPAGGNFSNKVITNVGAMQNKGIELSLDVTPLSNKVWNWDISLNASYNKNEVTKLEYIDSKDNPGVEAGWIDGSLGTSVQRHQLGRPSYSYYLYKQIYDEEGNPLEGVYADLNGDGLVNEADLYHTKSAMPDYIMGLGTSLSYKRWSVETMLRASIGNYVYNNMNSSMAFYDNVFNKNNTIVNTTKDIFNTNFKVAQPRSDYYLENASFLKMDYLTLNYDFGRIRNGANLKMSLSIQNVFTITKYSGYDPEIAEGIDREFYPRPRIYSLGLNLNF